jgi:hypothetical protein
VTSASMKIIATIIHLCTDIPTRCSGPIPKKAAYCPDKFVDLDYQEWEIS